MKHKTIAFLLPLLIGLGGCKQDNWLDWRTQNTLWLQENAQQAGVITTPTGLQYKVVRAGVETETRPDDAKTVTVTYTGSLINGCQFDGGTGSMNVTDVVDGFREGLKQMRKFGTYELYIPYNLGYGVSGHGTEGNSSYIPPYSTLIFRVTLDNVQ